MPAFAAGPHLAALASASKKLDDARLSPSSLPRPPRRRPYGAPTLERINFLARDDVARPAARPQRDVDGRQFAGVNQAQNLVGGAGPLGGQGGDGYLAGAAGVVNGH